MSRFAPLQVVACLLLAGVGGALRGSDDFKPTDLRGHPLDVVPKVIKASKLKYPDVLGDDREKMFRGSVIVHFTLTEKSEVLNPVITKVSHPAFVPPALDALFQTQFSPGMIGGVPVACGFTYSFTFDVEDDYGKKMSEDPFVLPPVTPPDCPEQFRYDSPPRPFFVCEPVYPRELLLERVSGEAKVAFVVDKTGRVAAVRILGMTRPEFGAAMVAAVETWRFTPASYDRQWTMTLVSRSHKFSTGNRDLASDDEGGRVIKLLRAGGDKIIEARTLPKQPMRRYEPSPEYPRALLEKKLNGEAEVEFIVDRKGRVRFPRVVSASHPAFGWAAATAVQQWYYEAPQVNGQAVDVRMVAPFKFSPPAAK